MDRHKIIFVGRSGVGKSSILRRYVDGQVPRAVAQPTIGIDFRSRNGMVLWDTAGQERFRALSASYFRGADAIVFVYDVTSTDSFAELVDYWLPTARVHCLDDVQPFFVLVGNKADLPAAAAVESPPAREHFAASCVVSARTGDGIDALFALVGDTLRARDTTTKAAAKQLSPAATPPSLSSCC